MPEEDGVDEEQIRLAQMTDSKATEIAQSSLEPRLLFHSRASCPLFRVFVVARFDLCAGGGSRYTFRDTQKTCSVRVGIPK